MAWLGGKKIIIQAVMLAQIVSLLFHITSGETDRTSLDDGKILSQLKNLSNSNLVSLKAWKDGEDPCQSPSKWSYGMYATVTCDNNSRVNALTLRNLSFANSLPDLTDLTALINLTLWNLGNLAGGLPDLPINLERLIVSNCNFNGTIPPSYANLKNLTLLDLSFNQLEGNITHLLNLSSLVELRLMNNSFSGPLNVTKKLKKLEHLLACSNKFNGSFSNEQPPNLQTLLINNNQLTGPLPAFSSKSTPNLTTLILGANNWSTGSLPKAYSNQTWLRLKLLNLANCNLTGSMPCLKAKNVPNLAVLAMGNNNWSSAQFPECYVNQNWRQLRELDMHNSNLNGKMLFLPPEHFPNLTAVDLSGNHLTEVDDNQLVYSLLNLTNYTFLLHGNPLCDNITELKTSLCKPPSDTNNNCPCQSNAVSDPPDAGHSRVSPLTLNVTLLGIQSTQVTLMLDIFTLLQGLVNDMCQICNQSSPSGQNIVFSIYPPKPSRRFSDSTVSKLMELVSNPSEGASTLSPFRTFVLQGIDYDSQSEESHKKKLKPLLLGIGLGLVMLAFAAALAVVLRYALKQKRRADLFDRLRKEDPEVEEDLKKLNITGLRRFNLEEITQLTRDFDSRLLLGMGGYGQVYRAELNSDKDGQTQLVAIKRASGRSNVGSLEFRRELELLSRVHHRHLVNLIGYCKEYGEQLLVMPLMACGDLFQLLHSRKNQKVSWRARLEIALGAARGLEYLHTAADPPIIHRDVKSTNILLDNQLVAKVSDFGLSKTDDGPDCDLESNAKGTKGYLDPEYHRTQASSDKSDVYSFGIVLLEIVTGWKPFEQGIHIVDIVQMELKRNGIAEVADPQMGEYPPDGVLNLVNIALRCTEPVSATRPAMREVVAMLQDLYENLYGAGDSGQQPVYGKSPQRDPMDSRLYGVGSSSGSNSKSQLLADPGEGLSLSFQHSSVQAR